jgi:hypothetical protein
MLNSLVAIVIGVLLMGVGIFEFIVWSELFFSDTHIHRICIYFWCDLMVVRNLQEYGIRDH